MSKVPFADGWQYPNIKEKMICTLTWSDHSSLTGEIPDEPEVIKNEVDCYINDITVVSDTEIHINVFVLDYQMVCTDRSQEDPSTGAPIAGTFYGADLDLVAEGEEAKIVQLKLAEDLLTAPGVGPLHNQMGGSLDPSIPLFLRLKQGSWEAPRSTYHIMKFIAEILAAYAEGKHAEKMAKEEEPYAGCR